MNGGDVAGDGPLEASACGYCGGPLPRSERTGSGDYCCYGCRVLGEGGAVARSDARHGGGVTRSMSGAWRIGAGALIAGQSMLFGLAANLDAPEGASRGWIHGGLLAGALVALGLLGPSLVREACRCAARGRMAVEWLFLAGAAAALVLSIHASVTGRGLVYYDVVSVLVTVHAAGKALTATARARAMDEAGRLEGLFARATRLGPDGREEDVAVQEVKAGERIRVRMGGPVPLGGKVTGGAAWVQEAALTGEALPGVRRPGDGIRAGAVALDGELEVEVEGTGGREDLDALLGALREARETVEDTVAWGRARRWAAWFLPLVLGVATATLVGCWRSMGAEVAIQRALSVILVACPCALGLSVPLGLWSALSVLATRGVRLRRASAIEALARTSHVCVDKTGTLTGSQPGLVDFVGAGGVEGRARWLAWMAAVEGRAGGVWSRAFAGVATGSGLAIEVRAVGWVPGCGIEAEAREGGGEWRTVRAGRTGWAGEEPRDAWAAALRSEPGDARLVLAVGGQVVGLAAVREQRMPGWEEGVRRWQSMGCQVEVLSGDQPGRLAWFGCGGTVPLRGGLSPGAKADRIREIQRAGGSVVFVGDGLNDGPALGAADVGLAIAEGSAAARALAVGDVGLGRLDRVADAIAVSRGAMRAVDASLLWALGYNMVGMGMAAAGVLGPVGAALLMTGSSVVVAWRAVRGARCTEGGEGGIPAGTNRMVRPRGTAWILAGSLVVQAPLAAWLGAMGWSQVAWMTMACVVGAAWVLAWGCRGRWTRMTAGMLGTGNLMMLVGWWVDAGMGPVMEKGVCLCCQSHHYFEAGWRFPWMWAGMVAGGMPWMRDAVPRRGGAWGWVAWVVGMAWMSAAMLAGMVLGGGVAVRWLAPMSPWQFVAAWGGMTAGMLLGMGWGCAVVEAVKVAWPGRR